jgi:O-antigen/teichoic acid export membrane protein/DNA-binding SARP family transcriptional activator
VVPWSPMSLEPSHALHRDQILECLWPDAPPESAANSLSKALHVARRALEPGLEARGGSTYIHLRDDVLSFAPHLVQVDVDRFRFLATRALERDETTSYEEALGAYEGELLPEDRYEDWVAPQNEALKRMYLNVLAGLANESERQGAFKRAAHQLQELLSQDETCEDIHRSLMRVYVRMGSRHQALRQYQECRAVLRRELDTSNEGRLMPESGDSVGDGHTGMNRRRIVSNLLIMVSGQAMTLVLSSFSLVLLSRYLGPGRFGDLTVAYAIVNVLGLLIGFGMDTWITRSVARSPERSAEIVSACIMIRVLLAIPAPGILFIYLHASHLSADAQTAAYLLVINMVAAQLGAVLLATLQGHERMSFGAVGSVMDNVLGFALTIFVIARHGGIVDFALIRVVMGVLLLAFYLFWTRRLLSVTWRFSGHTVREAVGGSLTFWASSLFLTFYMYIDSVILASLAGTRAVGFYTPATYVFAVALFVPTIVGAVTLPSLSRLGTEAGTDFVDATRKTLSLLLACAIPLTVGLISFAGPIISIIYGPQFGPSTPVLMVIALCIPFTFLSIQVAQALAARNQQWRWTVVMGTSCLVNPVLNLVLIPLSVHQWHNGALGAAYSLLATETLMVIYGILTLRHIVFHAMVGRVVLGVLTAGAAQAAVVWFVGGRLVVLGEVLGGCAYLTIAIVLNAIPRQEVRWALETALRRPRRPLLT